LDRLSFLFPALGITGGINNWLNPIQQINFAAAYFPAGPLISSVDGELRVID
jgi:hypothetical protein